MPTQQQMEEMERMGFIFNEGGVIERMIAAGELPIYRGGMFGEMSAQDSEDCQTVGLGGSCNQ